MKASLIFCPINLIRSADDDSNGDCDCDWRPLLTALPSGHWLSSIEPELQAGPTNKTN